MCGINGLFHRDNRMAESGVVRRMNDILAHRGPDGEGIHVTGPVALGHRRLAIIDLSESGQQPMLHEETGTTLIFNGEIYNFQALRHELASRGHVFRGRSDSEVVLRGYVEWGTEVFNRLEGFFALGIWDAPARRMVLARDAFGVKPLFYALDQDKLLFSSEIKGLLSSGLVAFEPDPQALFDYMTYFYVPGRQSIVRGVRSLGPGEVLTVGEGAAASERYWRVTPNQDVIGLSPVAMDECLRETISDCVKEAMIADVPVGLLLSGGLDSNIILHALKEQGERPEAYTVRFNEASYDEGDLAAEAAQAAGLKHVESRFSAVNFWEGFAQSVYHLDSLNANPGASVGQQFYHLAGQHCKAALVGSGGDELFGGYPTYRANMFRRWFRMMPGPLRRLGCGVAHQLPVSTGKYNLRYVAEKFCRGSEYPAEQAHGYWRSIFDEQEKMALMTPLAPGSFQSSGRHYTEVFERVGKDGFGFDDASLLADLELFLGENANMLADQLGMAYSLEVRPPLLSRKLARLALAIPFRDKVNMFQTKKVLRRAYANRLPDGVLTMRKHGAVAPLGHVLAGMRDEVADRLDALPGGYFDSSFINTLIESHYAGHEENSFKLYSLLVFGEWYEQFSRLAQVSREERSGHG